MSDTYHCGCGEWMGEWCAWHGPAEDMVVVEYLPAAVRASHAAARNSGSWPRNGAVRVAVERSCADRLLESEGDPNGWPDGCTWAAVIDADPRDYADAEEAQR